MKAFLLAAGNGTRLRPLTDGQPKCLLPIRGVPLLAIWLRNCRAAGIEEVLINAHAHADQVRDFVCRHSASLRIRVVDEPELLGSAGTIFENRSFVEHENCFFILYADVLTNANLPALLAIHHQGKQAVTIGIHQVPDPTRCGIVTVGRDNIVRSFSEKPSKPAGNWAFSGIMVADPAIIDLIPPERPADIGFHLLPRLIGAMAAHRVPEFLMDIGTLENYTAAQTAWPGFVQSAGRELRAAGSHL